MSPKEPLYAYQPVLCTKCNSLVRPVIACDIDGTIADYHGHFLRFAREYLNLRKTGSGQSTKGIENHYDGSLDLTTFLGVTKEQYRSCKLAYRQGGMKRTQPLLGDPGPWLKDMVTAGAEIWMTTTRPYLRMDNIDPDTRFWLERHGLPYDHLLYDDDKYGRLVELVGKERIVLIIDDLPDLYDRAEELGLPVVLRKSSYNAAIERPIQGRFNLITALATHKINQWNNGGNDG